MVKTIKKNKLNNKKIKKSKCGPKTQSGGVSNSSFLSYDNNQSGFKGQKSIGMADLHNINPQASGDLDNKFMMYGGPVPLGQMGGGGSCGSEGVGTGNPKSNTFQNYLKNLDTELSIKGGGNCGIKNNQKGGSSCGIKNNQKGAGYTFDTSQMVAGNPVVEGYPDNNPPALIGDKLVMGSPEKSVCGNGATRGGSRKRSQRAQRAHKSKKSKNRKSKNRKSKKNRSKSSSKSQRGGGDFISIGSKPASMSNAFDGPKSVFNYPDDMKSRAFDEKQPNYSVNAI